jgi:hypothetical protein
MTPASIELSDNISRLSFKKYFSRRASERASRATARFG